MRLCWSSSSESLSSLLVVCNEKGCWLAYRMSLVFDLWFWHDLRGVAGNVIVEITLVVDVCNGLPKTSARHSWLARLALQWADARTIANEQFLAE